MLVHQLLLARTRMMMCDAILVTDMRDIFILPSSFLVLSPWPCLYRGHPSPCFHFSCPFAYHFPHRDLFPSHGAVLGLCSNHFPYPCLCWKISAVGSHFCFDSCDASLILLENRFFSLFSPRMT